MKSYSMKATGPKQWRVKVSLGLDPATGKYRQKSKTIRADSVRGARRLADDWVATIAGQDDAGTVRALGEAWLERSGARNKASTNRGYRTKMEQHIYPVLGDVPLLDLDRYALAQWQNGLTVRRWVDGEQVPEPASARTVNQCIGIVRAMFRWGHRVGRVSSIEFLEALEAEPVKKGREPAEPGHVAELLDYLRVANPELALMAWLALTAGLRRGEILALQVRNVDVERGALVVTHSLDRQVGLVEPKTEHGRRAVALPESTVGMLDRVISIRRKQWRAWSGIDAALPPETWLFPSPRSPDRPRYPDAINEAMSRALVEIGLPDGSVTMHRLRHNYSTICSDAGIPSHAIARSMGHGSTSLTEGVYIGQLDEMARRSALTVERWALELAP